MTRSAKRVSLVSSSRSAGVQIQPAHRDHPASGVLDEIVNRGPAFGIFESGDVTGGLVQQQVDFLGRFDRLVVESHFVARQIHPVIGGLDQLSIHFDAARANPLAGVGARSQARLRKHALQCFERTLWPGGGFFTPIH